MYLLIYTPINACRTMSNHADRTMSNHVEPCRSNHVEPCRTMSIHVEPCRCAFAAEEADETDPVASETNPTTFSARVNLVQVAEIAPDLLRLVGIGVSGLFTSKSIRGHVSPSTNKCYAISQAQGVCKLTTLSSIPVFVRLTLRDNRKGRLSRAEEFSLTLKVSPPAFPPQSRIRPAACRSLFCHALTAFLWVDGMCSPFARDPRPYFKTQDLRASLAGHTG